MALILRTGGSQSPDRWLREPRNNQFDSNASTAADFIKEITSFIGGRVATLVIEELILFIFITNLGMNSMLVKIVAQVIVIVLNYVISKLIVFKK